MSLEAIIQSIQDKLATAPQIGARLKFDFGPDGLIHMDATQNPVVFSQEDAEADTTFVCSVETFEKIIAGTQDPTMAFMTGKLQVKGSMGYAMKLNSILGD
jgi:putative sterol carrier protein